MSLPGFSLGDPYSLLVSAAAPEALAGKPLRVELAGVASKTLHEGDPDFYVRARGTAKPAELTIAGSADTALRVRVVKLAAGTRGEFEPNDRWQDANPVGLGEAIAGSADDVPYVPAPGSKAANDAGVDWFKIPFQSDSPKLVFFQLELIDRDNIPMDVSVWRVVDGKAVAFSEGEDPVTLPHEVQALPGNKFTARLLREPGDYYVRVVANHPVYTFRTRVYDPPPYADPQKAVRTAMDYLLGAGDSWHANTPRRGGVWDRVANVHQETSLCVACHPTHFTQRAALYANRNGYPIVQRDQLEFLAERFYNNPRPLFGFEQQGAVWARVISAPANVLGRMSHLMDLYEKQVTGERRAAFHEGVAKYLQLYYQGRDKLPPDETNGNQPLVSTYEVAWYAWEVTRDPAIARLIEQDAVKNLVDLCYQTLALAAIDREKHAAKIQANADRILSLQRDSGQWSMKFEPAEKEVEFQTGHCLWALQAAGIPRDNPQVAKGLKYLLSRQQSWGGWMDPLQSFENFRTPFRESQMAVLALSAYYPARGAAEAEAKMPAASPDSLDMALRLESLAHTAPASALPEALAKLGDDSKLVQRAAAYLTRQIYVRKAPPSAALQDALKSQSSRARWGATRIFATHFAALATRPELAESLVAHMQDSAPFVQVQAIKGLWQFWFWSPSAAVRGRIEDALLGGLKQPQHPWVETNLREAIYNVADENIRYLYNNWVPALASEADRKRVVQGRLDIEARQAAKFAEFLERENDADRKRLLHALNEFPLRRADIYDPKADHESVVSPPAYNRIGNDIEQIVFFGTSAERLAKALAPLQDSPDPELKRLARDGALLVRDANFGAPTALAGSSGPERAKVLAALPPPKPRPAASAKSSGPVKEKPDESYFRGYVQPILETRGKDGYACVHCHATHTIFNGTWGTALNVVDLENPENSLILRKPTSSAEEEGTLAVQSGGAKVSHGGGVRWERGSPEYNTILNWIKGAKP